MWQSIYDEMKNQNLVDHFVEGVPDKQDLFALINSNSNTNALEFPVHQLLIFDDLLRNNSTER